MRDGIIQFKEAFGIDYIVCCYSERGVQQLADILAYRAERAQYELWREECEDLAWEEYLYFLSRSAQMQENVRRAMIRAQREFGAELFDFDPPVPDGDGKADYIFRLPEGERRDALVILFLFKAELEHHRRLCAKRGNAYPLERYMQDLRQDDALAASLRAGFEDAVRRLDFRAAWRKEGFDATEDLLDG